MKTNSPAARSRSKVPVLLLSLVVVVLAAGGLVVWCLPPPSPAMLAASNGRGGRLDVRLAYYVQSGQWRADARTFAALVRYLVSPEPGPLTNSPTVPA